MKLHFKIDLELMGDRYDQVKLKEYYLKNVFGYHGDVFSNTVYVKIPRYGYPCSETIKILESFGKNPVIIVAGYTDDVELKKCFNINNVPCIPLIENPKSFNDLHLVKNVDYVDFPVIGTKDLTSVYGFNKDDLMRHIKSRSIFKKCYIGGYSKEKINDLDFKNISTKYFMVSEKEGSDIKQILRLYDSIDDMYKHDILF